MRPCYTLSQVMDNPSSYFTSNTTVVFPPGHHEVSTEGQLVIQNVNNISLVGDNNDSTMIKCVGEFGLVITNITNLTVSKLQFSMCGAPVSNTSQLGISLFKKILHSFTFPNIPPPSATLSIYLLHITNLTKVAIQVTQVNCTEGNPYGLTLNVKGDSTNCPSKVIFHMSHGYFGRNTVGVLLYFSSISYSIRVKLEKYHCRKSY